MAKTLSTRAKVNLRGNDVRQRRDTLALRHDMME